MAREQHAELVDTRGDFVEHDAFMVLQMPVIAGELVHRQHRVVARMIRVVAGWTVRHALALHDRVVIRE